MCAEHVSRAGAKIDCQDLYVHIHTGTTRTWSHVHSLLAERIARVCAETGASRVPATTANHATAPACTARASAELQRGLFARADVEVTGTAYQMPVYM